MIIAYNFFYGERFREEVVHKSPGVYDFDGFRGFSNFIRENLILILDYNANDEISFDNMLVSFTILRPDGFNREFTINLSNIREFDKYKDMSYEDIENLSKQFRRNYKLEKIGL